MCGNAGSTQQHNRLGPLPFRACHRARRVGFGCGSHFLASRLVKFTERYPDLDLQLVATARLFSLSKREADIAISLTMPKEGRIVGRKLLDYSLGLYAAPAYLDRAPK